MASKSRHGRSRKITPNIAGLEWQDKLRSIHNLWIVVVKIDSNFVAGEESAYIKFWIDRDPVAIPGPKIIRYEIMQGRPQRMYLERMYNALLMYIGRYSLLALPSYFEMMAIRCVTMKTVITIKRDEDV